LRTQVWTYSTPIGLLVSKELQDGWKEIWADWDDTTHGVLADVEDGTKVYLDSVKFYHDANLEAELIWKKLLQKASWFDVKRVDGEVIQEQVQSFILPLDYRIFYGLIKPLTEDLFISQKENDMLYRQCVQLFHPNSSGVLFPNKWIRKYCELQMWAEKFGVSAYKSISEIPQKEYLRLKRIAQMESERRDFEMKAERSRQEARAKSRG